MTDHTRTEKIDGDSIDYWVIQVERETVDSLVTPLGKTESDHYLVICCLSCYFACLIYLFSFCDLFMAFYFVIFEYFWCHFLFWLWIRVGRLSAHIHVHLHSISSIPELRPFRRKCWLRSREIIISAMASQTLPEFMVLITSWDNNLRTIIRRCSHSNRTLSVWTCNGWGSGCLTSPLGTSVRNDSGTF